MKTKLQKYSLIFSVGGVGYAIIELMWRGHTHWTMILAGGVCFLIFSVIAERFPKSPKLFKAALCAVSVTAVELAFGTVFNLWLKMNVWDYGTLPLNFHGQICLLFTLLWGALGFLFLPLADRINKLFTPPPTL